MKRIRVFALILAMIIFSSCGVGVRMDAQSTYRNSIYYTSVDDVGNTQAAPVGDTIVVSSEESYETLLHKFDSPTYELNLQFVPTSAYYGWRYRYPYYTYNYTFLDLTWDWLWYRYVYPYGWSYYDYYPWRHFGFYTYYSYYHRPRYHHYTPYRPHRPAYNPRPNHRPDIRYERRGGTNPYRARPASTRTHSPARPSMSPSRSKVQHSNRPKVHTNERTRPTSRGNYSRSTVHRSTPTHNPPQRYTPSRSNTGHTNNSHSTHHSSGSTTRRK